MDRPGGEPTSISGLLLAIAVAVPLGFSAAARPGGLADRGSRVLSVLVQVVPGFWLGLVLLWILGVQLRWIRPFSTDAAAFVLPVLLIALHSVAVFCRVYADATVRGSKKYPKLMHAALTSGRVGTVEMLGSELTDGMHTRHWMPGFSPEDASDFSIEVLGPLLKRDGDGGALLRWFGDKIGATSRDVGKTKNGHSVILRISHRDFTLVLGGDLNRPAEDFLLRAYGGSRSAPPAVRRCNPGSRESRDWRKPA